MKAVTVNDMHRIESNAQKFGVTTDMLMENAGIAVANAIRKRVTEVSSKSILFIVGSGNNGGDGLVASRILTNMSINVQVFIVADRKKPDINYTLALQCGVQVQYLLNNKDMHFFLDSLRKADIVVDAVLGTGKARPITGWFKEIFAYIKAENKPVYAIDIPTGIDADTGEFDNNGLTADITLSLGFAKIGVLSRSGTFPVGKMQILDIGIPEDAVAEVALTNEMVDRELASMLLPIRSNSSHKGSFGRVFIVAGCRNYLGAAVLAASAAVRSGVGVVHIAVPASAYDKVAGSVVEAIWHSLPEDPAGHIEPYKSTRLVVENLNHCDAILIGPGLGTCTKTRLFLQNLVIDTNLPPVVLDADGINNIANIYKWHERTSISGILTPHSGEMARLTKKSVELVEKNRLHTARESAKIFRQIVVLKGSATIIANTTGELRVTDWANSGLATAGTGDVLAGLMAGLLAQMPEKPFDTATLAVYLHGLSGSIAASEKGTLAMSASDVIQYLPNAFKLLQN